MTTLVRQIDAFFGDGNVQKLLNLSRETRALRVCFPREVPLSHFLAWIFDPTQGHGLQDMPLRRLLTAAGRNQDGLTLPVRTQRFLGAASLSTNSFMGALIEKEVQLGPGSGRLDILILDPAQKLLIAIENKAGARTSNGQLDRYASALAKQYPNWMRVHIFMDMYANTPDDKALQWIPLDYQWLADEMFEAESSPWLGDESRQAIRDFRCAIDFDENPFVHLDEESDDVLEVVQDHPEPFNVMSKWVDEDVRPTSLERWLAGYPPITYGALSQLFTAYWQRRELWLRCLPMCRYAGWFQQARQRFSAVRHDTKKARFLFALPDWDRFESSTKGPYPLRVVVRLLPPDEQERIGYAVMSILSLPQIGPHVDDVQRIAMELRKKHLKRNRSVSEEQRIAKLRIDRTTNPEEVGVLLVKHLTMLDQAFREI